MKSVSNRRNRSNAKQHNEENISSVRQESIKENEHLERECNAFERALAAKRVAQQLAKKKVTDLPWNYLLLIFIGFAIVRVVSALIVPIPDCDETFNYWEPTHLLLYKTGLQTWEYSPKYALRSYLYIWIHAAIGVLIQYFYRIAEFVIQFIPQSFLKLLCNIIQTSMNYWYDTSVDDVCANIKAETILNLSVEKILLFYGIRSALGVFSAFCEVWFLRGVASGMGRKVALYTGFFLLVSSGMFLGAQNYLPSTFSMYFLMIAFGSWFYYDRTPSQTSIKWIVCVCTAGVSVIVGWPFSVVCVLPLAFDTIYHIGFVRALRIASTISAFLIFLTVTIDQSYYEKLMFTPWNLINYNKGHGSEKYGVETWTYYLKNLFLNFNIAFIISLFTPFLMSINYFFRNVRQRVKGSMLLIYLIPYYLWVTFFSTLPHKEERFMTVIYPLICLAAALSLKISSNIVYSILSAKTRKTESREHLLGILIVACMLLIHFTFSVLRIVAVIQNYAAPMSVYRTLSFYIQVENSNPNQVVNVCVGKEWYRFPSSFFLPSSNTKLRFLRTDFRGLLPKYFADWPYSTSSVPSNMNDQNREEMDRYIDIEHCDYLIDLIEQETTSIHLDSYDDWEIIYDTPFLIAEKSPQLSRAFWNPFSSRNFYGSYAAFKHIKKQK